MQVSTQIELTTPQIPLSFPLDYKASSVENVAKEHKNYISVAACTYEHIIINTELTFAQKLLYFTVDAASIINLHYQNKRVAALSANSWADKIGCSRAKIFALQKTLQAKKYFHISKQKNNLGQHKRNLITPTIPNKHIFKLHSTPNIRNLPDLDIDNIVNNLDHNQFKRFIIDKSKFFVKLDFSLFNKIAADANLSDFEKIIFLDFYLNSYKSFFASKGGNCSFTFSYKDLMARYSRSKSYISKAINNLLKCNYINRKQSFTKHSDNNEANINDRQDYSIWTFSVDYDFNNLFFGGFGGDNSENESNLFSKYSKLHYNIKYDFKQNIKCDFYNKTSSCNVINLPQNKPLSLYLTGFSRVSYSDHAVSYSDNYCINKISLNYKEDIDNDIDICTNNNFKKSSSCSDSKYLNYLSEFYKNNNFVKNPFIKLTEEVKNEAKTELQPNSEEINNQPKQEKIEEQVKNNQNISYQEVQKSEELKEVELDFIDCDLLNEEEVEILQFRSKKGYNANFMNGVLLKLRKKYPQHRFKSRKHLINYMSIVLKNELHESAKVNNARFIHKANIEEQERLLKEKSISVNMPEGMKEEQKQILLGQSEEENQEERTDWDKIKEEVLKAHNRGSNREEIAIMLLQVEAEENKATKTIKLKITSNYIRKQVARNYGSYIGSDIEKYARALGYEKIIISGN